MERILFNIPEVTPHGDFQNSFFLSIESLMKYLGYNFDYEFLLGISLHAFRTNLYPDLSISSLDPFTGFNTGEYLLNAMGLTWDTCMGAEDEENASITIIKIVDSINRDIPVIAIHIDYTNNWGLITGYGENVSNFYGVFFNQKNGGNKIVASWPYIAIILNNTAITKTRKEIIENALKNLSYILTPGIVNGYYNGELAFAYIMENKLYKFENEKIRIFLKDIVNNRKIAYCFLNKYGNMSGITNISDLIELYKSEASIDIEKEDTKSICKTLLNTEEKILDKL